MFSFLGGMTIDTLQEEIDTLKQQLWNVYYDNNSNQLLFLRVKLCNHWGLIGMSYSIDFTSEAIADLAKIDRTNQIRIATASL